MDAIIGNRGLVGLNICQNHKFIHQFNSSNVPTHYDSKYDTVVCAAAPGSMLLANRDPVSDKKSIDQLIQQLSVLRCNNFILISTIAVLSERCDSKSEEADDFETSAAYGINRRKLEVYCRQKFDSCLIVRLPALFGKGLKKNFIFDILNPAPSLMTRQHHNYIEDILPLFLRSLFLMVFEWNTKISMYKIDRVKLNISSNKCELESWLINSGNSALNFTNPDSIFQFYNLSRLWTDIEIALTSGLRLLHISPAPLKAKKIYYSVKNTNMPQSSESINAKKYQQDMQTLHSHLWGSHNSYITQEQDIINEIKDFCMFYGSDG